MVDYKELSKFCKTKKQKEMFKLIIKHGSVNAASNNSGISRSTIKNHVKLVKSYATSKGYAPELGIEHRLSASQLYTLDSVSDMRENELGKPIWYKYKLDKQKEIELIEQIVDDLKQEVKPIDFSMYKPTEPCLNDLINHFTLTDTHIGDWISSQINGNDWDLDIAEDVIVGTIVGLVEESPRASTALLSFLGDILHFDSALHAKTPHSGHDLDSAATLEIVAPRIIPIIRRVIEILLSSHNKLIISIVRGNHDEATTVWLKEIIKLIVAGDGRIELIEGRLDFLAWKFGDVFLGWYHGDKIKTQDLPLIFATEYPELWGSCKHVIIHCGDKHHHKSQDIKKVFVIQHEIISARNRYTSGRGLNSARGATRYTYHSTKGRRGWGHYSID